ncbi:zona pellucida-like domain-containing protein 1 [Protopterus annectens]|uniref:zona pellucida-like domain-containing protein 1 n=1 Tax=Protopterus annectens TaxID=7888 RepID=UPI001CFBD272|nr:zona pellucida-like domain-containing protein 1 [Protopterus annectens]
MVMEVAVYLCPLYYIGFNESLLALNEVFDHKECKGEVDTSGEFPLLKFKVPLNNTSTCGSNFQITTDYNSALFKDFSNIQSVNISGYIKTYDPSVGTVSYMQDVVYKYSCVYPLEYFVNNTRLDVAGVAVAVKDGNGTLISMLTLKLYCDENCTHPIQIPSTGLMLKTQIFAEIRAQNLSSKFNVLLDHCFASVACTLSNSTIYDLFLGCSKDQQTQIIFNGKGQQARFSFTAFRFTEHKNLPVSTFCLHCVTRICEKKSCNNFIPVCAKKRSVRSYDFSVSPDDISEAETVSSQILVIANENEYEATLIERKTNKLMRDLRDYEQNRAFLSRTQRNRRNKQVRFSSNLPGNQLHYSSASEGGYTSFEDENFEAEYPGLPQAGQSDNFRQTFRGESSANFREFRGQKRMREQPVNTGGQRSEYQGHKRGKR